MIGPEGYLHRWTAPRKIMRRLLKINVSTRSLVERLCEFKIYAITVLSFISSVCDPDKVPSKPRTFSVQLQNRTTLDLLTFLELAPYVVFVTPSALWLAIELQHVRPLSTKALRKSRRLEGITSYLSSFSLLIGSKKFNSLPRLVAPRVLAILFVAWTMMANLMKSRRIGSRRSPQDHFVTNYVSRGMLDLSLYGLLKFWDRSDVIELRTSCST